MATILRGTDLQMDREVAVKVLHPHLADDPEVRHRFAAEARHAASLTHPHVVTVYDQGEADLPFIVLELVNGPSLREVLATHGPLDPAQLLAVIEPLCDALDAAHAIGLIHRDVKPDNVLITEEGLPKLADFGIARVMAATSHTATGTFVGSVHYLAPEMVDGVEATPASDQYALAVVAYELLTGRRPLPADTPMAVALRHANEDIPPPSRYAPEVPAAMDAAIARATSRDPAARYPDLASFAHDLRGAVDGPPAPVTHLTDDGMTHTLVMPSGMVETSALTTRPAHDAAAADLRARRQPSAAARARVWPRRVGTALITLAVLALLGAGGWLAWTTFAVRMVVVPELTDRAQGDALAALEEGGLRVEIAAEEYRLDVPAGQVIGQSPASGTELPEGEVVELVLSLGPRIVDMPNLLGEPLADVREVLEANAFEVVEGEPEHHDTVPEGAIIAQLPDPGTAVPQGSEVAITVSRGIEQVTVPDLAGLTLTEAEEALGALRLTASVTEEWSDEQPEAGVVITATPGTGEVVDALSTVALVVSKGPLTISTPDLRGMSVQEATDVVAGLAEITLVPTSEPRPTLGPFTIGRTDRVIEQIPAAGEPVQRGGTIEIFYYAD